MEVLTALFLMFVFTVIARFITPLFVGFLGAPGALISGKAPTLFVHRFGIVLCFLGQIYALLFVTGGFVTATMLATRLADGWGWVLWPLGFIACLAAVWPMLRESRLKRETGEEKHLWNIHYVAITYTARIVPFAFIAFAIWPWLGNYLTPWLKSIP